MRSTPRKTCTRGGAKLLDANQRGQCDRCAPVAPAVSAHKRPNTRNSSKPMRNLEPGRKPDSEASSKT